MNVSWRRSGLKGARMDFLCSEERQQLVVTLLLRFVVNRLLHMKDATDPPQNAGRAQDWISKDCRNISIDWLMSENEWKVGHYGKSVPHGS